MPVDNALEPAYGFLFLKASESRRKIFNIVNAIRTIERRITFDLFRICNKKMFDYFSSHDLY